MFCLFQELNANSERMKTVNALADEMVAKDPTGSDEITNRIQNLNSR